MFRSSARLFCECACECMDIFPPASYAVAAAAVCITVSLEVLCAAALAASTAYGAPCHT
jgi:hypothetical protein